MILTLGKIGLHACVHKVYKYTSSGNLGCKVEGGINGFVFGSCIEYDRIKSWVFEIRGRGFTFALYLI